MGLFYANLTVAGARRDSIIAHLREQGVEAFVSPETDGLTVVFERKMDEQKTVAIEALGCSLTKALNCSALAAVLHDDDVLLLWLFLKGEVADRYNSSPAYFDSRSEHLPPEGGDDLLICGAFQKFPQSPRVRRLLRANVLEDDLPGVPGEQERHAALAAELGHPPFVARLGYYAIAGGYAPEYGHIVFKAVKDQV
jgi:hypothetical protein